MTKEEYTVWKKDYQNRLYDWAHNNANGVSEESLESSMYCLVLSSIYDFTEEHNLELVKNRTEYAFKRFKDLYETIANE